MGTRRSWSRPGPASATQLNSPGGKPAATASRPNDENRVGACADSRRLHRHRRCIGALNYSSHVAMGSGLAATVADYDLVGHLDNRSGHCSLLLRRTVARRSVSLQYELPAVLEERHRNDLPRVILPERDRDLLRNHE